LVKKQDGDLTGNFLERKGNNRDALASVGLDYSEVYERGKPGTGESESRKVKKCGQDLAATEWCVRENSRANQRQNNVKNSTELSEDGKGQDWECLKRKSGKKGNGFGAMFTP